MDFEFLVRPISESAPCGVDLDGTAVLGEFDRLPVFGQLTPRADAVDWSALRRLAIDALSQSKDLRPLTHLAAAELRLSGLAHFVVALETAVNWLHGYWDDVYPRIDEDAIQRQNSLDAFADRMAVIDALRRIPLVSHRQLGAFSLRDVEIAQGSMQPAEGEEVTVTKAHIEAAFSAADIDALGDLMGQVTRAMAASTTIETVMRERTDGQAAPDLSLLAEVIQKIQDVVAPHLKSMEHSSQEDEGPGADDVAPGVGRLATAGPIRTREDAIRSLEAVADFFRRNEPSSPVPLFADRTRRLIEMDFVQLLGEIAPGALPEVRGAAGLRDED